jgi:hypothetical protein
MVYPGSGHYPLKGRTYEEKCKELELETLQERRKIADMAQVFKLVHGIDKISRISIFQHVPEGRTRLAADPLNIRTDPVRTDIRKHFFSKRVIADWNRISPEIKNSRNVHTFKEKFRRSLN